MTLAPRSLEGKSRAAALLAACLLTFAIVPAGAAVGASGTGPDPWIWNEKLTAPQPGSGDGFGSAVDLTGDLMVIAAENENTVHVFERTPPVWTHVGTLSNGDGGFGHSVATNGKQVMVAAPGAGTVRVYAEVSGTWTERAVLDGGESFGDALDVHEQTLVVGSPDVDRVEVFERSATGWEKEATLDTADTTCLGVDVAIDGDSLAASAVCDADEVFVFHREQTGWLQTARLTSSNVKFFGKSVDLDEASGVLAAGDSGTEQVTVFERADGSWQHAAVLTVTETPSTPSGFGRSVVVDGETIAVGAAGEQLPPGVGADEVVPCDDIGFGLVETCPTPGAVYIFQRVNSDGTWIETQRLMPPDAQDDDGFGASVAMADGTLVAGAPVRDLGGWADLVEFLTEIELQHGGAHVFDAPHQAAEEGAPT